MFFTEQDIMHRVRKGVSIYFWL